MGTRRCRKRAALPLAGDSSRWLQQRCLWREKGGAKTKRQDEDEDEDDDDDAGDDDDDDDDEGNEEDGE